MARFFPPLILLWMRATEELLFGTFRSQWTWANLARSACFNLAETYLSPQVLSLLFGTLFSPY